MKKSVFLIIAICVILIGSISFLFLNHKKKDNYKFTFWSIQLKPVYEEQIKNIIKEFEKKHPNYKVVWIDIPIQEAQKRTLASILSSTPPDLINLNPDFSAILAQRGALEFFNPKDTQQFNKNILNRLKYKEKIYALPFYATSPVTIYNKETYKKCIGDDFIKSYDDLFRISPKLVQCSSIPSFVSSINENDTLARILNKYGISSLNKDIDKKEAKYIYQSFNKMYKNNELPKDILSLSHREVIEKYMSNQATITVTGTNFINMIKQNAPDIYSKSQISKQLTGKSGKYDIALMNLIIPKKSQHKDLALEFALLLTNKENQLELSKITNVLPVNKYALEDNYFKNCSDDLYDKARCISAQQLDGLSTDDFGEENKKEINEILNKTLEEILLDTDETDDFIENKIQTLAKKLHSLQKNK